MRKLMIAAAAVALMAAACGEAAEDAVESGEAGASVSSVTLPDDVASTPAPSAASPTTVADEPIVDADDLTSPKTTNPGNETPPAEEDVSQPVSHPDANVAIAMTDLVARFGVDAGSINVKSVEEVTWSDGSLGCPLPGMRYTQALVNGTRIVLEVAGSAYEYHSGAGREPFYCADPADPVSGGNGDQ